MKQPCGILGCDPVKGQCLSMCTPVQFSGPEPLDSEIDFPEPTDDLAPARGLSNGVVISVALWAIGVTLYVVFW